MSVLALRGGGGEARWRRAMAWIGEADPGLPAPILRPTPVEAPPDDAAAIRRELGLDLDLAPDERARRRRAFLWRNHPDRQPPAGRERATARVALANALCDGRAAERRR